MISIWSVGTADDNMPERDLVATLGHVQRHPWWEARARMAQDILVAQGVKAPASLIDIGCGWGTTLRHLQTLGYRVTGADISRQVLEKIDRPHDDLVLLDLCQPPPPDAPRFAAALALDVVEHIDDDRLALEHLARFLVPGGTAIVSVPALPGLYSSFDEIQGHRRRYTPERLSAAFERTGLKLLRTFWWGRWMVPLVRFQRRRKSRPLRYSDYLKLPPWPAAPLMRWAHRREHALALAGRLDSGTTLFAVATRHP